MSEYAATQNPAEADKKELIGDKELTQKRWKMELEAAYKEHDEFRKIAKKALATYRSKIPGTNSSGTRVEGHVKYNAYWSFIQTIRKITFARVPNPVVSAYDGHSDNPIVSKAEALLEKGVRFFFNNPDKRLHPRTNQAVFDFLVPGRGVLWPKYVFEENPEGAEIVQLPAGEPVPEEIESEIDEEGNTTIIVNNAPPAKEDIVIEYVHYLDYLESVSKTEDEIRWKAKRAWLRKEDVEEYFGKEVAIEVENCFKKRNRPNQNEDDIDADHLENRMYSRLEVWEIHSGEDRKVYFICPDAKEPLKVQDDFNQLEGFYPTPEPMKAVTDNDSTVPVSEYKIYKHLVDKINELAIRRALLHKGIKIAGVYDGSTVDIKTMFNQMDTSMIAASNWEEFATAGGFDGKVQFVPIEDFVRGLEVLGSQIAQYKEEFFEISGYSSTMRDGIQASQPAAAVQQVAHFTNARNSERQEEVQRYLRDIASIVAELICKHCSDEMIVNIAGEYPNTPEEFQLVTDALALLRNVRKKDISIKIATDSTIAINEAQEKRDRIEFANMASNFLQQTMQLIQTSPVFVPAAIEMFLFVLDSFRVGRPVEEKLIKGLQDFVAQMQQQQEQEPPPDPQIVKAQMQQQTDMQRINMEAQKNMAEASQNEMDSMMKFEGKMRELQIQNDQFMMKLEFEQMRFTEELKVKYQTLQVQMMTSSAKIDAESKSKMQKALIDAETSLQQAQLKAQADIQKAALVIDSQKVMEQIKSQMTARVAMEKMATDLMAKREKMDSDFEAVALKAIVDSKNQEKRPPESKGAKK